MAQYTLFLDESDKRLDEGLKYFCLYGCVIEKDKYANFETALKELKKDIFGEEDLILSRKCSFKKDIPPYRVLEEKKTNKKFWDGIYNIVENYIEVIIGGVLDKDLFHRLYKSFKNQRDEYYVLMQIIIGKLLIFS